MQEDGIMTTKYFDDIEELKPLGLEELGVPEYDEGSFYENIYETYYESDCIEYEFFLDELRYNNYEVEVKGGSKSVIFNIEEIQPQLKTEPNTAFFWSGKTNGIGGADVAAEIARGKGGVTLETLIDETGIQMPEWDFNNPSSMDAWDIASASYAEQVSGEVRAIVGTKLRSGNIWENVELPRLIENLNVTKITIIDPQTGIETVIFER